MQCPELCVCVNAETPLPGGLKTSGPRAYCLYWHTSKRFRVFVVSMIFGLARKGLWSTVLKSEPPAYFFTFFLKPSLTQSAFWRPNHTIWNQVSMQVLKLWTTQLVWDQFWGWSEYFLCNKVFSTRETDIRQTGWTLS